MQCPNEAFIDAEPAAMRDFSERPDADEDEDEDAGTGLSHSGSDLQQDTDEDGDFWSGVEGAGASAEERRGRNMRGLLAPRPNQRPDLGLPPRGGGAKERHTRHQVRLPMESESAMSVATASALSPPRRCARRV